jgi:hypothetical protein
MENSREFLHFINGKVNNGMSIRTQAGFSMRNRFASLEASLERVLEAAQHAYDTLEDDLATQDPEDLSELQKLKIAIEDLKYPVPL